MYMIELLARPGSYVCHAFGMAIVMTFDTREEAEAFRWSKDALFTMGTKVVEAKFQSM